MNFQHFSGAWEAPLLPGTRQWLNAGPRRGLARGLAGSGDALLISDLFRSSGRPLFVFVENSRKADTLGEECRSFLPPEDVSVFPSRDAVPYSLKSPFGPTEEARLRVLGELLDRKQKVYIAPHPVLLQKLAHPKTLFGSVVRLRPGDDVPQDGLARRLVEIGFRRETATADIGTFSIRGGIVDVYPFLSDNPLRIEYWGETIESIREFDVFSQKSLSSRTSLDIFPMREFCMADAAVQAALEKMASAAQSLNGDPLAVRRLEQQWKTMADQGGMEWFLHWFDLAFASLFDYCDPETIVVWDDPIPVGRRLDESLQNYERHRSRVPPLLAPFVSPPSSLLFRSLDVEERIDRFSVVYCDTIDAPHDCLPLEYGLLEQPALPQQQLSELTRELNARYLDGFRCVVLSPNLGHAERLQELVEPACPFVEIALGFLGRGFLAPEQKLLLFSENQITGRFERPQKIRKRRSSAPLAGFDALSPGDFVVHEDHGIARFIGVERVQTESGGSDCMVLVYAENVRVYVPIQDFCKVQKYIGKDTSVPALSRVGSSSWARLKQKTRESLREMAGELIGLYAKRAYLDGISFAPDTLWQKEFEDAFLYEETPDQVRAIAEVKTDMEAKKPMDRLICGDVGFGKTEVAMRAAFKAVMSGYQVVLLAPTTILAAQHAATVSERMASFPVKIACLSRFQRRAEQQAIVQRAAAGELDILVGTHRLLSADLRFKNLGLLIIDEEQRFGVRHKEKLKLFRSTIDVLSLTATPIPRTLHLSLIGARDLSIIATPPRNRLPVETRVAEYLDEIVKSAIENELERGGQVYFVNNRIRGLEAVQDRLSQLVPSARVAAAHGRMNERALERIMREFVAGRFDVLLSTVIIENGLDIPNVNTVIVNRADTMGLSQLYQIRGRVGRAAEQAYAYFLTPPFREVQEASLLRLRALEQFTDLGSGFQIAMRDLEIRGAGNILGTRQHGFIAAVGFELYCRLLREAVAEIKGEPPAEKIPEVKLDVPLEAFLPTEYIADGPTRIEIYQELSSAASSGALAEIERGMADRFGPLPAPVGALLLLLRLKCAARALGASRVAIGGTGELSVSFDGEAEGVRPKIMAFMRDSARRFSVSAEGERTVLSTGLLSSGKTDRGREALAVLQKSE